MSSLNSAFSPPRWWSHLSSELRRRVLTGVLLLVAVFLLSYGAAVSCTGAVVLRLVVVVGAFICFFEASRLVKASRESQFLMMALLALPALFVLLVSLGSSEVPILNCVVDGPLDNVWPPYFLTLLSGGVAAVMLSLSLTLWTELEPTQVLLCLAQRLIALLHVGLGWGCIALMTLLPDGSLWLLALVLVVSSGDIGAYFGGRYFKGPKLLATVSPGKTWSGAAVGLLTSVCVALVVVPVLNWGDSEVATTVLLGGLTAIAAQLGDLLKSTLKRVAGVKDSGHLLPGHGGLYDRTDGLLAAAPVFLLFMVLP